MAVLHRGRLHAFGRPDGLAADLWDGIDVDLDLGAPADAAIGAVVGALPGVRGSLRSRTGRLVRRSVAVTSRTSWRRSSTVESPCTAPRPRPPSLEDVYFEVEARIAERGPRAAHGSLLSGAAEREAA